MNSQFGFSEVWRRDGGLAKDGGRQQNRVGGWARDHILAMAGCICIDYMDVI